MRLHYESIHYEALHKEYLKYYNLNREYDNLILKYNNLVSKYNAFGRARESVVNNSKLSINKALDELDLNSKSSPQEVKNKFRLLIKKYHPDHNKTKEASIKYKKLIEAYELIKQNLKI